MPMMTSARSFRLATTSGHVVRFKAGEPVFVSPVIVPEAMQAGVVPVDPKDIPVLADEKTEPDVAPQGTDRQKLIIVAIEKLIAKNRRSDFTAAGRPHVRVLSDVLGFEVEAKERDTAFDQVMATQD